MSRCYHRFSAIIVSVLLSRGVGMIFFMGGGGGGANSNFFGASRHSLKFRVAHQKNVKLT